MLIQGLPELERALKAQGFKVETATVNIIEKKDEISKLPIVGLDLKI